MAAASRPVPRAGGGTLVLWAGRSGHRRVSITRALNDAGIPCPSAADPGRNPHRSGAAWTLFTVRAILANPRYTGHQVWNRQPTSHELIDPATLLADLRSGGKGGGAAVGAAGRGQCRELGPPMSRSLSRH